MKTVLFPPLKKTSFSLDVSGIAGFFGGEESFAAMSSVHLMRGRRWMGWYNSPGSYYVAKKYGTLAKSRLWNGLFPGPVIEPAEMLELDSSKGPRYMGVWSGTRLATTGHLSYLLARYTEKLSCTPPPSPLEYDRSTNPSPEPNEKKAGMKVPVKVKEREAEIEKKQRAKISVTIVKLKDFEPWNSFPVIPEEYFLPFDPFGFVATLFTVLGGIMAALWGDWYSFAMIFLGAISNGVSCYVLGSGCLELDCPKPSPNSPAGDGVLINSRDVIILKGNEQSVSNLIRGRYYLHYDSAPKYKNIGWSSVILTAQFLLQLFLVPQGILIGQIMFLSTFVISWAFNAYLASVDRETLQTEVLLKILGQPKIERFTVDKWSTAAAFVTFYLRPADPEAILNELVPNSTPAWNVWKARIVQSIKMEGRPSSVPEPENAKEHIATLKQPERDFVFEFLDRADKAWEGAGNKSEQDRMEGAGLNMSDKTFIEDSPYNGKHVDSLGKRVRGHVRNWTGSLTLSYPRSRESSLPL